MLRMFILLKLNFENMDFQPIYSKYAIRRLKDDLFESINYSFEKKQDNFWFWVFFLCFNNFGVPPRNGVPHEVRLAQKN